MFWLEGTWQDTNLKVVESWKYEGSNLVGIGFQLDGTDTIIHEDLAIAQIGYGLMYIAKVDGQNNGEAITFGAREVSTSEALFANNKHDFPSRIHYQLLNKNHIRVSLSSLDGKQQMELNYTKVSE